MKITDIKIKNDGYVECKSCFYSANDILNDQSFSFSSGINELTGEIDSGIWAVSYLMSMYSFAPKSFVLFDNAVIEVNGNNMPLGDFSRFSCYMDKCYPLFNSKKTVKSIVEAGIKKNKMQCSAEEIRNLFKIDAERFKRPLSGVGNEIFNAMAAIGYVNNKQVYCFPWFSEMRYGGYHNHIKELLKTLSQLGMTVVVPVGK